jgi:hypothetical protein
MARRKSRSTYFFETFNGLVDLGLRLLSRSEIVAYLVLLRDTKPDGTARTSFTDIAARGGISRRAAVSAVQSLVERGVIEVVRRGNSDIGPSTYCVVPGGIEVFRTERASSDAHFTGMVKKPCKKW